MKLTIGERLKTARLERKLSLAQAAQGTRIRARILEAMENDDFGVITSRVQLYGFVRIYAEWLNLDADALINQLRGNSTPPPAPPPPVQDAPPAQASEPIAEPLPETSPPPAQADAESPASPQPVHLSQSIFAEIGAQFRARRELLSLTLSEAEQHTHVRKHYLDSIEKGAIDELPSPVQARGMLTAYARFLDMDTDSILLRFAEGLQARRIENMPPARAHAARKSLKPPLLATRLRRYITIDLLFGLGLIIAMTGFAIFGANRIIQLYQSTELLEPTGPSISEVLLTPLESPAETEAVTPTAVLRLDPEDANLPGDATPIVATPIPTLPSRANVLVIISVVDRTFLRVIVDGKEAYNGRAEAGQAFPVEANQRIEVLTGNGAAVQIVYNDQNLGPMGTFGEVVNMVYTASGMQTPTPTVAPTATNTPTPTRTLRPTPTLPPTRTPRPSPAPTLEPGG